MARGSRLATALSCRAWISLQAGNQRRIGGQRHALGGAPLQDLAQLADLLDLLGAVKSRTAAPRLGSRVTMPIRSSSANAWRTAWRLASKRCISTSSTSRSRGFRRPNRMSNSSALATSATALAAHRLRLRFFG